MSEPLRIAHVITRLIRGGADENTILSCNTFAEHGHDVTLVFGSEVCGDMRGTVHSAVRTVQVEALRRSINAPADAAALVALRRLFGTLRPDIVHTHTSKAGILGRAAAIGFKGTAVVHGIHILPFVNVGTTMRLFTLSIERALAPFTDRYVSVSPGMRDLAVAHRLGAPDKHHVMPSGMELSRFKQGSRTLLEAPKPANEGTRRHRVLYLANYEPRKQQCALVEALAASGGRFSDTVFLLAGQGRDDAAIRALIARHDLAEGVKVLGFVEDVGGLLASVDLCLYCSTREGLPRAVVQYCAAGVPVVAHHLPGIEVVLRDGENGRLCPQGDFFGLLDGVRELLDDSGLRAKMAKAAASTNLDAWSADRVYDHLHAIYLDALRRRSAA